MKTVLITGSNRGIGCEIARQCARKNMHVILSGRDEAKLQQAVKAPFSTGRRNSRMACH